jgi:hypothetical protein
MRATRATRSAGCALLVVAAAITGATACTSAPAPTSAAHAIATANAPAVPSGLSFHARLDGALSSDTAHAGDRFTATIDEPLRASDGSVAVPSGSTLTGRVIEVDRTGIGRLTLQFDGVTVDGRVLPIDAQILRIEHARVVAADATDPSTLTAFVYPVLPMTVLPPQVGGGPRPESVPVELAIGAQFQLVLSRPLLAPARRDVAPAPAEPAEERMNPRIEGF